jgi:hypothetical protein
MKRPAHYTLSALTLLSLLLCASTIWLWARSYDVSDHCGDLSVVASPPSVTEKRWGIYSSRGRLAIGSGELRMPAEQYAKTRPGWTPRNERGWFTDSSEWVYCEYDDTFWFGFALYPLDGHGVQAADGSFFALGHFVSVPHPFAIAFFAVFPAWWFASRRDWCSASPRRPAIMCAFLIAGAFILGVLEGPMLFLAVLALGLIALTTAGIRVIRRVPSAADRRAARGMCRACGYDLRGTPNRCPECGTFPLRTG